MSSHVPCRCAQLTDAELLWAWRNEDSVRANSFNSDAVAFDHHVAWLKAKLASEDVRLWIVEVDDRPAAQVRFERLAEDAAEVHISVAADARGRGVGRTGLNMTCPLASGELGVRRIVARIKATNLSSIAAFRAASFSEVSHTAGVVEMEWLPKPKGSAST